jgi:hypothetical protein
MWAYAHHTLGVDEKVKLCTVDRLVPSRWSPFHRQVVTDTASGQWSRYVLYEIPINVFPEKELCGLSPNFHVHVAVSDL